MMARRAAWPAAIWHRRQRRLLDRLTDPREALASLLFGRAPTGALLVDPHGRVVAANAALTRLLAAAPPRPGSLAADLFVAEQRAVVGAAFVRALAGRGDPGGFPARLAAAAAADPYHLVFVAILPLAEGSGAIGGLLVSLADISDQRRLEAQFAQAQRLQAIGQVAGGLAHDFNNLLGAVSGAVELLLERPQLDAAARADLDQIAAAAARGAVLVRRILALGREQALQPQVIAANAAMQGLSELLRRLLGPRIEIVLALEEPGRLVRADPLQLDQAVVNLAVNARDAMPQGGRLTLRTGHRTLLDPVLRGAETVAPGRYVVLAVEDTGAGIAAADLPRIFDAFFTTRRADGGSGLGLAMVDGFVRQSGGFIEVASRPGQGTSMCIHLPRHDAAAIPAATTAATPPAAASVPPPASGAAAPTVLLVDDEAPLRDLAARAFARRGWQALTAASAAAALELLHGGGALPDLLVPDLLVSDVVMPGLSGPELVIAARRLRPALPAILVSGYAEPAARDALGGAAASFLAKPYALRELVDLAERLVAAPDAGRAVCS